MLRFTSLLITLLVITGCTSVASVSRHTPKSVDKVEKLQNYQLGKVNQAYVGDPIVEKAYLKYTELESGAYTPVQTIQSTTGFSPLTKGTVHNVLFEDKEDGSFYIDALHPHVNFGIKIDKDGHLLDTHPYYRNFVWTNHGLVKLGLGKVGDKLFKPTKSVKNLDPESFKVEIIYLGLDDKNMKAAYREYKDDIARPAFYQDITYNLEQSNTIRYKNYKIDVIDFTNEYVKFTVLED